uniref:Uncharacterized protein n=1 Tax=Oryza sativa subsp. japonica TaxID=39947 RepID=Q6H4X5_ORYSJ|nr:hypothetical protein [Oryza sativa Japonica Group]BAD26224.1 hypothetical protein [Oryza sativa Japonica Group]
MLRLCNFGAATGFTVVFVYNMLSLAICALQSTRSTYTPKSASEEPYPSSGRRPMASPPPGAL